MDSPKHEPSGFSTLFDESASYPRRAPAFGAGAIAALLLGGVPYVFALFLGPALAVFVAGSEATYAVPSSRLPHPLAPEFLRIAVFVACLGFVLLLLLFRYVGLPRPAATLCLLILTVAVVHLQLVVTIALLGFSSFSSFLSSALWASAFTGLAVPITVAWNRGHGFRWAAAVIIVVAVVRALADWNTYEQQERERFDEVMRTVSEYPDQVALLESQEWSAIQTRSLRDEYLGVVYEDSDGDRIEVTTWADFASDVLIDLDDPDPANVIRHRCETGHFHCEETEEAGLPVVLLQSAPRLPNVIARVEWRPGVYVEIRSWEKDDPEELRALVGLLRPAEEGDAMALAEEITAGPRR